MGPWTRNLVSRHHVLPEVTRFPSNTLLPFFFFFLGGGGFIQTHIVGTKGTLLVEGLLGNLEP